MNHQVEDEKLRMVVIDDILTVVNGIARQMPWEQHRIEVVGIATNGEEGLGIIRQFAPHIIITDIRMPKMDGLTMIKEAKKENPNSQVIFMSGYTDFNYAQQSHSDLNKF